jgi:hypothetical protein
VQVKSQSQLRWLERNLPDVADKVSSAVPEAQLDKLPERLSPQQRSQKRSPPSPSLFSSPKRKLFGKL